MSGDAMKLRETVHAYLTASALAFVAAALAFGYWPEADLAVAAFFATERGDFPANRSLLLGLVRHVLWSAIISFALFALAMVTIQFLFQPVRRIATRVWGFVALTSALGPGILVNEVLKTHWGRARPRDIEAFGGEAGFTPALVAADECVRNCSFVSGEASGLFTAAAMLTLVFLPGIDGRANRIAAALAIWVPAVYGATLRIAMGAHFLSDVVFAFLLSAILTLALFLVLRIDEHLAGATVANVGRDVRDIAMPARNFVVDLPRRML